MIIQMIMLFIGEVIAYVVLIWFIKLPIFTSPANSKVIMNIPSQEKTDNDAILPKPNIIILLADDLGWNDVSFHGSDQIPTPNIDAIAYNGIIFNDHYVGPSDASTRASLLTGKHFINLGLQHGDILEGEPRGLRSFEKLLPEYLKEVGYQTHAIGKWQLGFCVEKYTPTHRGFDSHYGFWTSHQDYYSHVNEISATNGDNWSGYDMRSNMTIDWSANGTYTTDLFTREAVRLISNHNKTTPLFLYLSYLAPHAGNKDKQFQTKVNQSDAFSYIKDPKRRSYAEKVSKLDRSVGEIMFTLHKNKMLENSIVLFLSDNGAQTVGFNPNGGSNYPLRGVKGGPWEGSTRSIAVLWSPLLTQTSWISEQIVSVVDWFTTLAYLAGANVSSVTQLDGINLWPYLNENDGVVRTKVVINIDEIANYWSIRYNNYKFINGTSDKYMQWYGDTGRVAHKAKEGHSPAYLAKQVLQSQAGMAIANVIKARWMTTEKGTEDASSKTSPNNMRQLSISDILDLRERAQIRCNKKFNEQICNPSMSPCLFDIQSDPCERNNIANDEEIVVLAIKIVLKDYLDNMASAANTKEDPDADPRKWNGTWICWLTEMEKYRNNNYHVVIIVSIVSAIGICLLIFYVLSRRFGTYRLNNLRNENIIANK